MEQLLEQAKKVSQEAEVFSVVHRETEASFESNRLKLVQTKESQGIALRLIKDGRIGFSATSKPGNESELLEMALEMSPFGAEAKFEFPAKKDFAQIEIYDAEVEAVSEEAMVELGQSLIDKIRAEFPELVCEATVSRNIFSVKIMNSRGGEATYQKSIFSISVEGVLTRDTDMLFVGDFESSCHPILSPEQVVQSTLEQLERAKKTVPAPTGILPVLFTPHGVASALITPLTLAFNGKTVVRGASPLGNRIGEQVFASSLSIWDDPTIEFRPASRFCDDEGMPSQRTALVEKGVVANFLYDLQTAGQAGTKSTGSASRTLGSLPSPSISALIIEEGEAGFEEMLAGIEEGLVIEQLMGATQGNVLGGEFSGNVLLGYKVEKGEIVGRVKNTMVAGNVYQVLKEDIVVGNKSRWIGASLKTPAIYCPRVSVAAKG